MTKEEARKRIIRKARAIRAEASQYFLDVEHWNTTRGKTEGHIDPDPDGSMKRIADSMDALIKKESL